MGLLCIFSFLLHLMFVIFSRLPAARLRLQSYHLAFQPKSNQFLVMVANAMKHVSFLGNEEGWPERAICNFLARKKMGGGLWQFFQGKDKFSGETLIASKWLEKKHCSFNCWCHKTIIALYFIYYGLNTDLLNATVCLNCDVLHICFFFPLRLLDDNCL